MKLKPVLGALLTGLVGLAYAQCYYETTYLCLGQDTEFKWPWNGGCQDAYAASVNWYGRSTYTQTATGGRTGLNSEYCHGPAYLKNCQDGHTYDIGIQYDDAGQNWYNFVDPNSPGC